MLQITFDDMFEDLFDIYSVTGDSGRNTGVIAPRKRRDLGDEIVQQIINSKEFTKLCKNL